MYPLDPIQGFVLGTYQKKVLAGEGMLDSSSSILAFCEKFGGNCIFMLCIAVKLAPMAGVYCPNVWTLPKGGGIS